MNRSRDQRCAVLVNAIHDHTTRDAHRRDVLGRLFIRRLRSRWHLALEVEHATLLRRALQRFDLLPGSWHPHCEVSVSRRRQAARAFRTLRRSLQLMRSDSDLTPELAGDHGAGPGLLILQPTLQATARSVGVLRRGWGLRVLIAGVVPEMHRIEPCSDPHRKRYSQKWWKRHGPVPRHEQKFFMADHDGGEVLVGAGLQREVLGRDVRAHVRAGLVEDAIRDMMIGSFDLHVTAERYAHYASMRQKDGEPAGRVEGEVRRLLDADRFRTTYPEAYRLWTEAEALLWDDASERNLSTIGLKLREATQEFAAALVARYAPPDVDSNPQATKNRIRAVIELHRPSLGERRAALLTELGVSRH